MNPRQLVPFIDHDGFTLAESNAILKYLCGTFDQIPRSLYPQSDLQKRAVCDKFLEWGQYHFRPALLAVLHMELGISNTYKDVDDNFKKQALNNVKEMLGVLNSTISDTKGSYLCGDEMTIADIQLYFEASTDLPVVKIDFDSEYPHFKEWLKKMEENPLTK